MSDWRLREIDDAALDGLAPFGRQVAQKSFDNLVPERRQEPDDDRIGHYNGGRLAD